MVQESTDVAQELFVEQVSATRTEVRARKMFRGKTNLAHLISDCCIDRWSSASLA